MAGTVLENLSGRKLTVLVVLLFAVQIACFLLGLLSPSPASSQPILLTKCLDREPSRFYEPNRWLTRTNCQKLDLHNYAAVASLKAEQVVFVGRMPLHNVQYTRWQQNLIGILQFEILYENGGDFDMPLIELTIDTKLGYSNVADKDIDQWTLHSSAEQKRYMDCNLNPNVVHGGDVEHYPYNCSSVPLFELGSLHHDYYLVNLRLPYDPKHGKNVRLQRIESLHLHAIHMNGGYMMIWLALKTVFFVLGSCTLWWFWNRVRQLARRAGVLEQSLLALGAGVVFLDCPMEYASLFMNLPGMLIWNDIRQGVFYGLLLGFWLVFAGEHMLVQEYATERIGIRAYWKHLSTIAVACLSLLVFDLCERGMQLINPFYSIWVTPMGTNLALTFIILAGLSACIYFLFLCYMIWRVFRNISMKRAVLPSMSQARRLHYEGIIYRFNFLMVVTVVCAALTVLSFVLGQVAEGANKWDEDVGVELAAAVHTGIFGMWNVYICAMLMLYAPSHKRWPQDGAATASSSMTLDRARGVASVMSDASGGRDSMAAGDRCDDIEFDRFAGDHNSANEISALTSFATKASIE